MNHESAMPSKQDSQVIEFSRPGLNPFMEVLGNQLRAPKTATPLQQLHGYLRQMERIAESGDLRAWQEKLGEFESLISAADLDPIRALEIKVQLKKVELTLLLKAGKRALDEARLAEKQATEAELIEDPSAVELKQKAQKLERMGLHLHQQLLARVA